MPNFKIFQDDPAQLRVKIYGSNDTALNTDASGNLGVTGTVDVGTVTVTTGANQLAVSIPAAVSVTVGSGALTVTGLVDVGTVTVTTGANQLAVSIPAAVSVTVGSSALTVTGLVDVGTITVTTGSGQLDVVTNPEVTDLAETAANFTSTDYSPATARTVLGLNAWTFAVKNTATATNAQAVVQVQMSATAASESDWLQEVSPVTLNQNSLTFLTTSLLVKYARVYYKAVNSSSAVTLSIIFQAQT